MAYMTPEERFTQSLIDRLTNLRLLLKALAEKVGETEKQAIIDHLIADDEAHHDCLAQLEKLE